MHHVLLSITPPCPQRKVLTRRTQPHAGGELSPLSYKAAAKKHAGGVSRPNCCDEAYDKEVLRKTMSSIGGLASRAGLDRQYLKLARLSQALTLISPSDEMADSVNSAARLHGDASWGDMRQVVVIICVGGTRIHLCLCVCLCEAASWTPLRSAFAALDISSLFGAVSGLQLSCRGRAVRAVSGVTICGSRTSCETSVCTPALRGGMPPTTGSESRAEVLARARARLAECESVLQALADSLSPERDMLLAGNRSGVSLALAAQRALDAGPPPGAVLSAASRETGGAEEATSVENRQPASRVAGANESSLNPLLSWLTAVDVTAENGAPGTAAVTVAVASLAPEKLLEEAASMAETPSEHSTAAATVGHGDLKSTRPDAVGQLQKLSADMDDEEVVSALFNEIDENKDGTISREELDTLVKNYADQNKQLQLALVTALKTLIDQSTPASAGISFAGFCKAVRDLPRVRAERVHFAQTLGLHEVLARQLPIGTFFDGLEGLRKLGEEEAVAFARKAASCLQVEVEALLLDGIRKLKAGTDESSALEQNSKFSMDTDADMASFAKLQQFYDGPEKFIGTPNPNATEGIRREHCERENADTKLTTPNYKITTTPRIEYFFVVDPFGYLDGGFHGYPHTSMDRSKWSAADKSVCNGEHRRNVVVLGVFTQHPKALDAGLQQAEVIALRLYTGPLYIWYNAVLRGFPKEIFETLEGNRYETTIFCIISGIIKLSKLTNVPEDRRLYRGLGGVLLPDSFWSKAEGFRGGVERGLMSATADRAVAMQYSGKNGKRCTIFEILVGRVDIGADLSWVSQYPNEKEVLYPPLSCLEVMGEPRVESGVIIVPLRVNMCLKGLTLEQLIERRKELHSAHGHGQEPQGRAGHTGTCGTHRRWSRCLRWRS